MDLLLFCCLQSFEEQDASESFQDISFSSEALSRSFDSSTQTMPPRQKTQSSQVDGRFLSTNGELTAVCRRHVTVV